MKKFFAIMFTVFYFGFSSGMVYNVHYCMNIVFTTLTKSDNTCKICGKGKMKDCSKDQIKVLKTDVAQKADISFITDAPFALLQSKIFYSDFLITVLERNYFSIPLNAPPDKVGVALFISYRNFRI
ncbi:hypothetical protein [Frigoriflavimonas asaccharolytica]|uniref:Uncharacterized protein n=1 Tax=Frigoriflavimonas asaccharolytica TaxID=2735899 RepID=A0A8J8K9L5_9FLAO|nr:hypothetical protein [Frigoriflavimonas asaccharolytica]NRS93796.1 hypothetical protein [Frigoriflavimonas asaccharolytica]